MNMGAYLGNKLKDATQSYFNSYKELNKINNDFSLNQAYFKL